ncbi:membrane hypothetical protein [Bradyrhizobium sp. STM 3843]|uniref:hypothetical protein n=1 Tax=Bradyrhizobium sp. STM 3843 TaxID=551947 RepID=UPI0002406B94|nr:hypothetical protein [Bradyrhizobium sp. STM 3843]CCE05778.1 membrane hypothetical protein [Bradyrhizobium sp. STM 3843]
MSIADGDFKTLLDTLEKSSNRTRSVYYVFAIIYISITLYAVNTFMFSFPDERLIRIRQFVAECEDPQKQKQRDDHCIAIAVGIQKQQVDLPPSSGFLEKFAQAEEQHRRDTYLDEIAASRKFTFPLFGVSVDRGYFWLMNSLIGVVIYFVLLSALANEAYLFGFMVAAAGSDIARLQLVLMTQMLSSPSDQDGNAPISYTLTKRFLLQSVILLPVAAGLMWICDDFYLTDILRAHFSQVSFETAAAGIRDDFYKLPILFTVSLVVQAASIVIMLHGFRNIKVNLSRIHTDYQTAHNNLKAAISFGSSNG